MGKRDIWSACAQKKLVRATTGGGSAASAPGPPPASGGAEASVPMEPQSDTQGSQDENSEDGHRENEVRDSQTATRVAESVLTDEEDFLKLSAKRKSPENKTNSEQAKKVSKINPPCSSSQSEDSLINTQENLQVDEESLYSFTRIRTFLLNTKGTRLVWVEDFFPDLKLVPQLSQSFHEKQATFTDLEVFRLRKLMSKVRAQMAIWW